MSEKVSGQLAWILNINLMFMVAENKKFLSSSEPHFLSNNMKE